MTREEAIKEVKDMVDGWQEAYEEAVIKATPEIQALNILIKELEQEPCEDCISRKAVLDCFKKWQPYMATRIYEYEQELKALPSVQPKPKTEWIPVSERLPEPFSFVNCTCHSLIDDRDDWVVETIYLPQPLSSPYSDWGNIPMLNWGECEVIAWMYRDIPEPYKAESEEV